MSDKKTIYVSFDVETNGPNILNNSCIMIGIAVSKPLDKIASFENVNDWILLQKHWCIEPLFFMQEDEKTMREFWSQNQELYNYIKKNQQSQWQVSREVNELLLSFKEKYELRFVARPTSFDITWVKTITDRLVYDSTLSHTAICISSMLKVCDYLGVDRKELDKVIRTDKLPHTHYADDDALQQLYMFIKLKEYFSKLMK